MFENDFFKVDRYNCGPDPSSPSGPDRTSIVLLRKDPDDGDVYEDSFESEAAAEAEARRRSADPEQEAQSKLESGW